MTATLTTDQKILGQLTPTKRNGDPAQIEDGTIEYTSDDSLVATIEEDPTDETKFAIVAKGEGTTKVKFSADADRGEGVVTITGEIDVTVLPASATGFGVVLGEPVEQ